MENQGLLDLQEFIAREEIIVRSRNLAVEEIRFREDMGMFFAGGYRLYHVAKDYYDLYLKLASTKNFATLFKRVSSMNPMTFGMKAWTTWTRVIELWNRAEYTKAGQVFADGMFTDKYDK